MGWVEEKTVKRKASKFRQPGKKEGEGEARSLFTADDRSNPQVIGKKKIESLQLRIEEERQLLPTNKEKAELLRSALTRHPNGRRKLKNQDS